MAVSPEDVTLAVIKVGTANQDHSLHRTSGGGAQDSLAPEFVTEVTPAPGAVEDLHAVIQSGNLILSWTNPVVATFSSVRVIRKPDTPPTGPSDGVVLYQGSAENYTEPLPTPGMYFYAVYTYDVNNQPTDSAVIGMDTRRYSLSGSVRDAMSSTGIQGAKLILTGEGSALYMTTTGADGGYSFASIPSGQYALICQADGYDIVNAARAITVYSNSVLQDFQANLQRRIQVTSPNGGEEFVAGAQIFVSWTSAGSLGNVRIEYSINNGTTWQTAVSSTPQHGCLLVASSISTCFAVLSADQRSRRRYQRRK